MLVGLVASFPRVLVLLVCATGLSPLPVAMADEAPIASARHATGKARADILSLRRTEGETLTLRFAVANDGDKGLSINLREVGLIDLVNRRSYTPGLTSSSFCSIAPTERTICWAVFGSPGSGVKTINVRIPEGFDLVSTPIGD
jgi:hypothetical protein